LRPPYLDLRRHHDGGKLACLKVLSTDGHPVCMHRSRRPQLSEDKRLPGQCTGQFRPAVKDRTPPAHLHRFEIAINRQEARSGLYAIALTHQQLLDPSSDWER